MTPPDPVTGVEGGLQALWYGDSPLLRPLAWMLLPVAGLYGLVTGLRRRAYRAGWLTVHRLPVPVLVVGNITTGGTGKTPITAWLAGLCREAGLRPGIVSRGYGGRPSAAPRLVEVDDEAHEVGDEPLLLRRETGGPVCVHPDRVAAGLKLVAGGVNVVIADDGLQHYRLHRDLEIVVLDAQRRLGNGWLLPAGPLREGASRLRSVDLVLVNGDRAGEGESGFRTSIGRLRALDGSSHCSLDALRGQAVRAVAGIGNPGRFHAQLAAAGLKVDPVPVADHGSVDLAALARKSSVPIIMTGKDGVKYRPITGGCPVWVAELELAVPDTVRRKVLDHLHQLTGQEPS